QLAEQDRFVKAFRARVLRGRVLTPRKADRWLAQRRGRNGSRSPRIHLFGTGSKPPSELQALCRGFAGIYGLVRVKAERFVLTGSVPIVLPIWARPVSRRTPGLSRIVLTIDPMLPTGEVAAFYRRFRQVFHPHRTRRISDKHAELARFVRDRRAER